MKIKYLTISLALVFLIIFLCGCRNLYGHAVTKLKVAPQQGGGVTETESLPPPPPNSTFVPYCDPDTSKGADACNVPPGMSPTGTVTCSDADLNHNYYVDGVDLSLFAMTYGRTECSDGNNWCTGGDLNKNSKVDGVDLADFAQHYGQICLKCNESDNGEDFNNFGITDSWYDGQYTRNSDFCLDDENLTEFYCDGRKLANDTISCPKELAGRYVCYNGYCKYQKI